MADRTKVQAAVVDLNRAVTARIDAARSVLEANDRVLLAQRAVDAAIFTLAKLAEGAPTAEAAKGTYFTAGEPR